MFSEGITAVCRRQTPFLRQTDLRTLGTLKTDKLLTDSWAKRLVVTYHSAEGEGLSLPDVYVVSVEKEIKKFPRITLIHMYGLLRACFRPRCFEPQIHLSAALLSREKLSCSRAPSMVRPSRAPRLFFFLRRLFYSRFRPLISKRLLFEKSSSYPFCVVVFRSSGCKYTKGLNENLCGSEMTCVRVTD